MTRYIKDGKKSYEMYREDRPDVKVSVQEIGNDRQVYYPVYHGVDIELAVKTVDKAELEEFIDFVIFKADIEMKSMLCFM